MKLSELKLTSAQAQERMNIRNCYLAATPEEFAQGIRIFFDEKNWFAIACLKELQGDY